MPWQQLMGPAAPMAAAPLMPMNLHSTQSNTAAILALVGAEIAALLLYVGVCEVRARDLALCEGRWALALPAIALAGQSAATYFMDSARTHTAAKAPRRCPAQRQCPVRILSLHLLDNAGALLRVLFLDRQGHISAVPHFLSRSEALILAANQQRIWGSAARILVL